MIDEFILQLLPYFEAVARLGNFTRAASQLGVTPPAVSQNIQALENQLGVRLFHRTSRSVRLSDEGRLFYQKVSPAMSQIDVAADDVRALAHTRRACCASRCRSWPPRCW